MRKLIGLVAASAAMMAMSVPASAATLTLTGEALGVAIGALPAITIPGSTVPGIFVSSAGGSFVEPANVFTGFVVIPKELFTGVSLISSLNVTVANGVATVSAGGGGGGGFGGPGPLQGAAVVGVLGGLISLGIPLSPIGNATGYVPAGAATLFITVTGHLWTTGVAGVTAVSSATPSGFVNTVTAGGFDNRTAGHGGTILLISPFRAITNAAGTLTGFATQLLSFNFVSVPEPGTLLLIGSGIVGLVMIGRKKIN